MDVKSIIAKPKKEEKTVIAQWDPYSILLYQKDGKVSFEQIEPDRSVTAQYDETTGQNPSCNK